MSEDSAPEPDTDRDGEGCDYQRVARAIRHLAEHRREQPGLAELARVVGLSEGHFQRMFTRWAGVSAKSFLQVLTLVDAKRLLLDRSVLATSLDAGLSGPSRLHDLFVGCEAMTPGEYRARAAGTTIRWEVHPTPFGHGFFAATERGLCSLVFLDGPVDEPPQTMRRSWSGARWVRDADATRAYAEELAARMGGAAPRPLALLLKGTSMQVRVWRALMNLPAGRVVAYADLASAAGASSAVRAVGTAIGANPIGYLIPCHRVIRASGALGGYRWGEERKRVMLALEGARGNP
ncbi:MAG: bifunctional helix-turn-helix domain-containing protein/methylated-DNA--[protein]-cysteine S-methyltransferase [Planctomycetes bacterium]|nr:bifunctional helix-turn-helix domain-containing protein/methylated-DNA--[protein]-cysteine S-methyltransferase [Planctomycetota bacterium]